MTGKPTLTPGTVSRSWPRARKNHRCDSCGALILRGERYYRWVGRSDAWIGLATLIECAACCERYGRPIPSTEPEA